MKINYKTKQLISQEESETQDVQFAIDKAKLQLQSDILATRKSLADKKKEIEEAKTECPLDSLKIISLISEAEGFENGLKKLAELQKELGLE